MISKRLRSTAFHEAGHAVVAHEFGIGFRYVTIEPSEDALGHIAWTPSLVKLLFRFSDESLDRPTARDEIRLGEYMSACLAGPEAEKRLPGRRDHRGAESDYQSVFEATSRHCGSLAQEEAFAKWRRQVAEDVVAYRWSEVEAVAEALLARTKLSSADVHRVVRDSMS